MKRIVLTALVSMSLAVPSGAESGNNEAALAEFPPMRWDHVPNQDAWNSAAFQALKSHGQPLIQTVPADIADWCPYYPQADADGRATFWIAFMSALAKHESTYRPTAVGGGGKWFGLLQIAPATARGYDCRAGSGDALKSGSANLSCAIRIMAVTVPRDGVIDERDTRWRGVAADWGPLRNQKKREDMRAWVSQQPFCAAPPRKPTFWERLLGKN